MSRLGMMMLDICIQVALKKILEGVEKLGWELGWDGMEKLVPDFYSSQMISTDK
jgi:hypothetical protein